MRGRRSARRNKRTRRSGSRCPDLRLRFASFAIYRFIQSPGEVNADEANFTLLIRTVGVFEEILVLSYEPVRKPENLKAVAIADDPELHLG